MNYTNLERVFFDFQLFCIATLNAILISQQCFCINHELISIIDRIRKICKTFPQIPLPQDLGEDDDMQQLNEALGAAKTRVECCMSFLKAAIK